MIDTVRFRLPIEIPDSLLWDWGHIQKPNKDGRTWHKYFDDIEASYDTKIRFTYYPQDRKMEPNPLVLVETSLPKLIYGNNVEMITDVEKAVKLLNSFVSEHLKRTVSLCNSELDRTDLCFNHDVGENVRDFIRYLFMLEMSGRKTKPYYPTYGVQFYSKWAALIFYDKYEECGILAAEGILREEASYVNKFSVRYALESPDKPAFITDFTPEVIENILHRENAKLGIDNAVIADPTVALKTLVMKYGGEQGMRLYGYLCLPSDMDRKALEALGIKKRTIQRNRQDIKRAGLGPGLVNAERKLPPLTVKLMG